MSFRWSAEADMPADLYLTPEESAKLRKVRIGVAGAGGLGSNLMMHLVRSGVTHFTAADYDRIAESNLNRQFFFRDQIGKYKTEALAENLLRIEPELDLDFHPVRVTAENVLSLFGGCDILAEAFDDPNAKSMLAEQWLSTGKPLITVSGIAGWGNSGAMKVRKIGKCFYLCGDLKSDISHDAPHSPRVGIAAALQANTIMALLLGKEI